MADSEMPVDMGEVSDGYHTFNELYRHRCLLFAWLMLKYQGDASFKTRKNQDGEVWDGWFIGVIDTPYGQISYHLPDDLWDLLPIRQMERNGEYDGHTSADVLDRIMKMIMQEA